MNTLDNINTEDENLYVWVWNEILKSKPELEYLL